MAKRRSTFKAFNVFHSGMKLKWDSNIFSIFSEMSTNHFPPNFIQTWNILFCKWEKNAALLLKVYMYQYFLMNVMRMSVCHQTVLSVQENSWIAQITQSFHVKCPVFTKTLFFNFKVISLKLNPFHASCIFFHASQLYFQSMWFVKNKTFSHLFR